MKPTVEALSETRLTSLIELFDAASSSCFCRYWHFSGNKNEWLDRSANRPEESAAELSRSVGTPEGMGLVAISSNRVVGWMKLTARVHLPKLRSLPVYRSLDLGDDRSTFSVGCILVHPDHRGRGVSRALVEVAPQFARTWGATAVEAYPRRSAEVLHPEEAWQGPENVFVSLGWKVVHDVPPYPVYRQIC